MTDERKLEPPAPRPGPGRWLAGAGLALIVAAAAWHFVFAEPWTRRIPPGWNWTYSFIGIATYPDPRTGKFPEGNPTGEYRRLARVISEERNPRSVTIEDQYVVLDPATGATTFEYITRALLDPRTGRHLDPKHRHAHYTFPRHVRKDTYVLRASYLEDIPLTFDRTEVLEGLEVYVFTYEGRGEYTASYAGSDAYAGVKVAAGQEICCRDDRFRIVFWVEPVSGEVLKLDESCPSGDYIYDQASGKPLTAVMRWGGVTTGDDVIQRAAIIRRERTRYLWAAGYGPLSALAAGFALLALAFTGGRARGRGGEPEGSGEGTLP